MTKDNQNSRPAGTSRWETAAIAAALMILLAPLLYLQRSEHQVSAPPEKEPHFIGSKECSECHQTAYRDWLGSHHDLAMAEADDQTVLGDFNNATFTDPHTRITSRFFKKESQFFVETEGPDGKPGIFKITHTFGVYPLQQYLIPFPGGRLQCLNIAWDAKKNTWYRIPPYDIEGPHDWLHWTRGGQTWNGMCAECHSTRLTKGFDIEQEGYNTGWFEIDVGCEACHGPGSSHAEWAAHPAMARPPADNYGLTVTTGSLDTRQQVTICAPCHSRRYQLGDNDHSESELLDKMVPSLLDAGLYYPDGQILDEVYVFGSFTQSKMYQNGVKCSDCHNIHSLTTHKKDNDLCLQCHRAADYDTAAHHFHKREHDGKPSSGYLCAKCHMPGRTYMGIDYRPDHSLRIPRPDLSEKLGTPNSCSTADCHGDKPLEWVNTSYTKWYGESRKPHYGETFARAREGQASCDIDLRQIARDSLQPVIVRATALSLLRNYPSEETTETFTIALQDEDALLRYTALRNLTTLNREERLRLVAPKLYDTIKAVRIEAALALASLPESAIRPADREAFQKGLEEYRQAMLYNADFAPQRYNLGNLSASLGQPDAAKTYYEQAIGIDDQFYPAKVNLAMQYNQAGENTKAEKLLREIVQEQPELYEISYSLGLLLAEEQQYEEAAHFLGKAADGMPRYSRARYNQALAFMKIRRWREAEEALLKVLDNEPGNREYFVTLVNMYLNLKAPERARDLAEKILKKQPGHPDAKELLLHLK